MMNILLPTDFSDNAFHAISYALKLFSNVKCNFHLLHTFTPAAYHSGKAFKYFSSVDIVRAKEEALKDNLQTLQNRLEKEYNNPEHSFSHSISFNLLVDEIRKQIREQDIDLIVMGTKGATGAKEIFIGTNTMYTIKKVKCPVIAVPYPGDFRPPSEVLFVTDYKTIRTRDLEYIRKIIRLYSGKLHVLHVYNYEPLDKYQKERKNLLAHFFDNPNPEFHLSEEREIPEAIESFQEKTKIDLVIMVQTQHSFLENLFFKPVINDMVYHTRVPLMILPVDYNPEEFHP